MPDVCISRCWVVNRWEEEKGERTCGRETLEAQELGWAAAGEDGVDEGKREVAEGVDGVEVGNGGCVDDEERKK